MIYAEQLTKKFGDLMAVNRIHIHVKPGEIYGFLGPNGAGKTTTIKMLTGILKPTEGTIKILGMNIRKNEIEIKRQIGVVPDEPRMYDNLRGHEFAHFIMEIYKSPREETEKRLEDICKAFGIDYLEKFIGDYSHGMKQKLMLATVLMRQPKVVFLDEPTMGLDARSAKILKLWLRKMADNGAAIFMTTHVLEIAEKMCDRIGIINEGMLVAEGTLEELKELSEAKYESLEDLFLELTGGNEFKDIIDQLGE
ncbi:ABC transporter ATP-binding protein [Kosmotoga pacifica]|uniref:ABC transporter n=1 Tax=Kosmotoga pacifica TaxID=1330330 RepID=A0A0G2ZBT7_9BACT|nr:ABC transporter ATP-binding protein [Kosmotoga pacifica]AKI97014.1 ABC transporter [Kosmotoga pacifica]